MVQMTHEEPRGGAFDYGGDPPTPTSARLRVVQFFDDGTSREVWRDASLQDLFASWDAGLKAQRDAVAITSGERAVRVQELEALTTAQAEQIAALTLERDQARARYEQLLSEVEPA